MEKEFVNRLVKIRRDLHQHPELSWEERRTAGVIRENLKQLDLKPQDYGVQNSVVAEIAGEQEGPFIALRADMDALPIEEETGLKFSSINKGVMHACAHDGHMSILLGAAQLLKKKRPPLPVRLIFQPAEEIAAGAKALVAAGALEDVAMIFGGHLDRHYNTGQLVVTEGPVNAASDSFSIEIHGEPGHGARPHETTDAIVAASLLIVSLQTIVSREVDPAFPSVVSVGMFQAGTASNVIAGHALIRGTIRSQHSHIRSQLVDSISRIANSIGELHGARIVTEFKDGTPPVWNTPKMTGLAEEAAVSVAGAKNVVPLHTANMGGEDFAYYLEQVPGAFVRYGAQLPGKEGFPAHSSRFDFDEEALPLAAQYLSSVAHVAGRQVLSEIAG